jgi:hypothetical protein
VIVVPPPENLGPPRQTEGAPPENGTPTDHFNVNSNSIKQCCNGSLGGWSPLTWALSYAAAGHLVIPLEHGRNIPHRRLLGRGWSAKAGTAGSRDPEQIKAWWKSDPSAMIGIVTAVSPLSWVLVIDIDTKPGKPNGWESIVHLMEEYGPLPGDHERHHAVRRDAPLLRDAGGRAPEVASCIRSAERYVGPEAEIHQQWIESLRRVQ